MPWPLWDGVGGDEVKYFKYFFLVLKSDFSLAPDIIFVKNITRPQFWASNIYAKKTLIAIKTSSQQNNVNVLK